MRAMFIFFFLVSFLSIMTFLRMALFVIDDSSQLPFGVLDSQTVLHN